MERFREEGCIRGDFIGGLGLERIICLFRRELGGILAEGICMKWGGYWVSFEGLRLKIILYCG